MKRLALLWVPVALGLALVLPTSTFAATGYTFAVVEQHCISTGHGHNPYFEVKLTAAGSTPANKLTIKSTSQYFSAGKWHNFYRWAVNKTQYTPNGQAHAIDYSYDHVDGSDTRQWRIKSVLKAWNGSTVLAHKTLTSRAC